MLLCIFNYLSKLAFYFFILYRYEINPRTDLAKWPNDVLPADKLRKDSNKQDLLGYILKFIKLYSFNFFAVLETGL